MDEEMQDGRSKRKAPGSETKTGMSRNSTVFLPLVNET